MGVERALDRAHQVHGLAVLDDEGVQLVHADATGLISPIVGHVGDGNFHLTILFDPNSAAERASAEGLAKRVSLRAIAMGGTCTGEHGIGVHKLEALVAEHGEAVELMQAIKRALDPRNIMNPGKTVPP